MTIDTLKDKILRLRNEGVKTEKIQDWRDKGLLALLLGTESGAYYVIEPLSDAPSLVTRISEAQPFYGNSRLPTLEPTVQRQGNPDKTIEVGKCLNIYGLPMRGTEFDPNSIYTTTPVVEIIFLETDYQ